MTPSPVLPLHPYNRRLISGIITLKGALIEKIHGSAKDSRRPGYFPA
jgi:hypothetical protein